MKQISLYPTVNVEQLSPGKLLIAEPFLNDTNFARTVIYLCDHNNEGSVGFVINQPSQYQLGQLLTNTAADGPQVFVGGPVQTNTLHMIHRIPNTIPGGTTVAGNILWGGSFQQLQEMSETMHLIHRQDVKLFIGYSGWGPGQLEAEIKEGTWFIVDANEQILFEQDPQKVWAEAISLLGARYTYLKNLPTDPQLN